MASRDTKKGDCKNCCEGMGNVNCFEKQYNYQDSKDEFEWVWSCNNCGHETPIKKSPTYNGPTPSQRQEIERIQEAYSDDFSSCTIRIMDQFNNGELFISLEHDGHILITMDYPGCAKVGVRGKTEYQTGKKVYFW